MKRTVLSLCALLLVLASTAADPIPYSSGSYTVGANEALVILNQLGLYSESGGTLTLKESLVLGDRLSIIGKVQTFKVDKNEREFVKVKAPSGEEGWVRAPYALSKVSLAAVKSDAAMVYSQPRDVSVTAQTISNMTLVAVFQEGSTSLFQKVNCYDVAQNIWYTETDKVYVPKEDLTFADNDINALIIYTTALAAKNKTVKSNLFKVIEKKYANSIFFDKIRETLAPETVVKAKASLPAAGLFVINDDNINVRSAPDEVNGPVVGKLSKGSQVEVLEKTAESYAIAGLSAPWYRIKEPAGWIFGSFMTPVQ